MSTPLVPKTRSIKLPLAVHFDSQRVGNGDQVKKSLLLSYLRRLKKQLDTVILFLCNCVT